MYLSKRKYSIGIKLKFSKNVLLRWFDIMVIHFKVSYRNACN